jgi:hypothetical protein
MVDIAKEHIDEISKVITKHHPSAKFEGIKLLFPPPSY